ncbi:uncharacterized protein EDB91DRAFT_1256597 [Suillus paluster]|uniref:uncharacterized protein n=1 Tax=Suillus paluster TaxID=48578 RepID=UPI001B867E22|nr:uncharacterized protein EDB91DRAFT_1256597 [Suillus paluster]KAG1721242.1 hypothetical protein EDB91DRAFT_1256597 [Suillus paluster]
MPKPPSRKTLTQSAAMSDSSYSVPRPSTSAKDLYPELSDETLAERMKEFEASSWANSPWGEVVEPPRTKRGPLVVRGRAEKGTFWPEGQEPTFTGKKRKRRIFVTADKCETRTEITHNLKEIQRLKELTRHTSTFEVKSGDILLYHDDSDDDEWDHEDDDFDDFDDEQFKISRKMIMAGPCHPPEFYLLQQLHHPNALSHLAAASRWINQGKKFPVAVPVPDDLRQLCVAVLTVPHGMLAEILPPDDISVSNLINYPLPNIAKWPFTGPIEFEESLPTGKVHPKATIPPDAYVRQLRANFGQALLDGKRLIRDPRNPDTLLPLWVIELWWALHCARKNKMQWAEAKRWLQEKKAAGKDVELFREAEEQLRFLPWNKSLRGPAAAAGRTTKHLRLFLSDDEHLSETLVDLMTASLVSFSPTPKRDVMIANTSFGDAIRSANSISYHDRPHKKLKALEDDAKRYRHLYTPVHLHTQDHYIAFAIDFETKSFKYGKYPPVLALNTHTNLNVGDSLYSKNVPKAIIEKLQWWFSRRLGGEFRNDGPVLQSGRQKDSCSCGLFAINTIAHNALGHALGVPDPASDRARWFSLTAKGQIPERQVVQRGRDFPAAVHPEAAMIVDVLSSRARASETGKGGKERLERQEKERLEREARERLERQEKERLEQARLEREARERLERQEKERLEREARERLERQEKERLEREARERFERQEKERLEREARERLERQEKERLEQARLEREARERLERQEKERLEREARERLERQEKERLEREAREI